MVDVYRKVIEAMIVEEAVRAALAYLIALRELREGEVVGVSGKAEPTIKELQEFLAAYHLSWQEFFELLWTYQVTGKSPKVYCVQEIVGTTAYYWTTNKGEEGQHFLQQRDVIEVGAAKLQLCSREEKLPQVAEGRVVEIVAVEQVFGKRFAEHVGREAFGKSNLAASPYI